MNAPAISSKLIKGATGDWEMVIGLEVHAQVTSQSKLFSGASTEFGGEPNAHVSLVDAAMPGMLPVINEECVRQAVRTGLGLQAKINLKSVFDRKNYFYPDLPQGYQISQFKSPVVGEGVVAVDLDSGESIAVGIERLHLEQDAGKSLHDQHPTMSFVDLNRSGVALMEIVSRPDMRSSEEAKAYVAKLRSILRYLGTCDGDMEKGSLRADVNVSVRRPGEPFGTRCEIKNVNSIRFIGQAIEYEARRQIGIIEDGGAIEQETRLFDPNKGETRSMRSKEEAHDYRYFPDPDLLPLEFSQSFVDGLKAELPELPDQKKARFIADFGLTPYDAAVLVAEKERADYYDFMVKDGADPKLAANWLINEYMGRLNRVERKSELPPMGWDKPLSQPVAKPRAAHLHGFSSTPVLGPMPPTANSAIVKMISTGKISSKMAKDVLEYGYANPGADLDRYVADNALEQVTDTGAIEKAVDEIVIANSAKVEDAKTNPNTVGWFVGQVMKSSKGTANPQMATGLVRTKLFENWTRTKQGPLQSGERLYDYYDQSARKGYEELRSILNLWVSEVQDLNYRNELISRITKGGKASFRGALSELIVYDLFVRLGQKISVHPVINGARRTPDFALTDNKGKVSAYVEVTTVNRPDKAEGEGNREGVLLNAIDRLNLPEGYLLGYELVRAGSDNPPLDQFLDAVQQWLQTTSDLAKSDQAVSNFEVGDWKIQLELFSVNQVSDTTGAIGLTWPAGQALAPHKDLRAALYRKSRGYGAMDAPYVIAVADAKDQMFGKQQVRDAVTEAVFGDERAVFVGGDTAQLDFAPNGFWRGPEGPRNAHVTAILFFPQMDVWKLRDPKWEPILALNPWTTSQLPNSLKSFTRLEADQGKWVERPGKPIGDLLGLPEPWPPIE